MPSIIGYQDVGGNSWKEHLCLVQPHIVLEDEDAAASMAEKHLSAAQAIVAAGGSPQDFALSLRHEGYNSVTDFNVVKK